MHSTEDAPAHLAAAFADQPVIALKKTPFIRRKGDVKPITTMGAKCRFYTYLR